MRRITRTLAAILVSLFFYAEQADAAISKVINTYQSGAGGSFTTTSIDTSTATFIVIAIADYSGDTASTISDNKGNSYGSSLFTKISGNVRLQGWAINVSGGGVGTGHTFTVGPASPQPTNPSIGVIAFKDTATSSALDSQSSSATGTGVSLLKPGAITPSEANEVVVTAFGSPDSYSSISTFGDNTADGSLTSTGTRLGFGMDYVVQTTATSVDPQWNWPGATDNAAWMIAVKAPAAGNTKKMTLLGVGDEF